MKRFLLFLTLLLSTNFVFADTLIFAQLTDVHIPAKVENPLCHRDYSKSKTNLTKAVNTINNDKNIQYVFFTGDSVDQSFEETFEQFFKITNKLNKPYHLALGNHDSNSPNGLNKIDTLKTIQKLSRYHQYYPNYCVELNDNFIAIMLDGTNEYHPVSKGYFTKSTLKWLDNVLEENKNKNVLIFQHFPIVEPAKEKYYTHKHNIVNKKELLNVIKRYNNVILVSSGHYHIAGEFEKYGIKHFSTPALFLTPSFYRVTEINYNKDGRINSIKSNLIKN